MSVRKEIQDLHDALWRLQIAIAKTEQEPDRNSQAEELLSKALRFIEDLQAVRV